MKYCKIQTFIFFKIVSISVTISGAPFKGFFIIAAEEGSKDWPSGVFYVEDPFKGRTVWCSARNDAATHSNDRWKDSVTLLWYGPTFTPADMIRFVYVWLNFG